MAAGFDTLCGDALMFSEPNESMQALAEFWARDRDRYHQIFSMLRDYLDKKTTTCSGRQKVIPI